MRYLWSLLLWVPTRAYQYVIIPGMGGSILQDAGDKTQLWPPSLIRPRDIKRLELQCDAHQCTSHNVVTMPMGDPHGIRLTNPITTLVTKNAYYNPLIDALSVDHRVHALPYDFRRLLDPLYVGGLFAQFQSYLETIRGNNDTTIIICHSLGGILFHRFLTDHVSDEWTARYLDKIYWVSVPFGGCPEAVHCVLTNSVNIVSYPVRLRTLKYFGGFYFLFPTLSNPVIRYHSTTFTPQDYRELFQLIGQEGCYRLFEDLGHRYDPLRRRIPPRVASIIVYTDDQPTKTVIDMGDIRNSVLGAGDGLVPQESLLFPLMWWNNENTTSFRVLGTEHSRICGHKRVISLLLDQEYKK